MKMLKAASALAMICAVGAANMNDAQAHSAYLLTIPNSSANSCGTCHVATAGSGPRQAFGKDYANNGKSWPALFSKDSDGDGYTNGVELGDPSGVWIVNGAPDTYVSHPGKADSTPCGNAKIDAKVQGSEECDGAELGGKTCADFGGDAGKNPVCTATCTIDSSGCGGAPVDMGMDMSTPDMDIVTPVDMGKTADMDVVTPVDMGKTADMGSTDKDMGTAPTTTPKTEEDEGCSSAGMGSPAGALALFGLLGMVGLRRRRR